MSESPSIRIGEWTARPALNLLERGNDSVKLGMRAMETLVYLARHRGEVVSVDELMSSVWKGVVVGNNSVYLAINQLRSALDDDREDARYIETIPRRGYRLVAPVEYIEPGPVSAETLRSAPFVLGLLERSFGSRLSVAAAAVALVAAGTVFVWGYGQVGASRQTAAVSAQRSPPSIVVLPFIDNSTEGSSDSFSDGISEGILNVLQRTPDLRVTPQQSAFWFKGKEIAIPEIAKVLGVDHVLTGDVLLEGEGFELTASLIEARTNRRIWSERYERPTNDVFEVQQEIAAEVVDALRIELQGPAPTVDETRPEVYRLYQEARHILANLIGESFPRARELLEQAVDEDPNYLPARLALVFAYLNLPNVGGLARPEARRLALQTLEEAEARWPDRAEVLAQRAWMAFEDGDLETTASYYQRALAAEHVSNGLVAFLIALNRSEQAVDVGEYIVDRNRLCGPCYSNLAHAYLVSGQYDRVEELYSRARSLNLITDTSNYNLRCSYAMALLLSGDAKRGLSELRKIELFGELSPFRLRWSAMALHDLGQAEFDAAFGQLRELGDGAAMDVAAVYAHIGELESAFDTLTAAPLLESGSFELFLTAPFLRTGVFDWPPLDRLREHVEWQTLAARAGIAPDPREAVVFEVALPD